MASYCDFLCDNYVLNMRYRVTSLAVEDVHQEVNKTDLGVHVLFAGTGKHAIVKVSVWYLFSPLRL